MRVGIYARVSTTDKGQHVGMQTRELEAYAKAMGWTIRDRLMWCSSGGWTASAAASSISS